MPLTACDACGTEFEARRKTARFCSDKCRYHNHLAKTKRITVPNDLRWSVLYRDEFRCRYCGATPKEKELHVDHIVSVEDGGALTDPDNLATACRACNLGKGKRSADPTQVP